MGHARFIRDQVVHEIRSPFFFKQVGGLRPTSGGDLLDGERWQQWPAEARR